MLKIEREVERVLVVATVSVCLSVATFESPPRSSVVQSV